MASLTWEHYFLWLHVRGGGLVTVPTVKWKECLCWSSQTRYRAESVRSSLFLTGCDSTLRARGGFTVTVRTAERMYMQIILQSPTHCESCTESRGMVKLHKGVSGLQ